VPGEDAAEEKELKGISGKEWSTSLGCAALELVPLFGDDPLLWGPRNAMLGAEHVARTGKKKKGDEGIKNKKGENLRPS